MKRSLERITNKHDAMMWTRFDWLTTVSTGTAVMSVKILQPTLRKG
jgi:hypothetical protein